MNAKLVEHLRQPLPEQTYEFGIERLMDEAADEIERLSKYEAVLMDLLSRIGRRIDRPCEKCGKVTVDGINDHNCAEGGAGPRPVVTGVPVTEVVPAHAGSDVKYTATMPNICPDCGQPYFSIPRIGISHDCSPPRTGAPT